MYHNKYIKYKNKYLQHKNKMLINISGGGIEQKDNAHIFKLPLNVQYKVNIHGIILKNIVIKIIVNNNEIKLTNDQMGLHGFYQKNPIHYDDGSINGRNERYNIVTATVLIFAMMICMGYTLKYNDKVIVTSSSNKKNKIDLTNHDSVNTFFSQNNNHNVDIMSFTNDVSLGNIVKDATEICKKLRIKKELFEFINSIREQQKPSK